VSPDLTRLGDLKLSEVVNDSQGLSSTPSDLKELAVLKVRLDAAIAERDMIRAERERERRQMQEQIENLQSSLATAQEQGSKALLLLTNQTGEKQGDQSQQLKELAKNVELVKRQNNHLNKKLKAQEIKAQESRTFWQWLVGPSRKTSEKPKETELSKAS
jgi:chromosome segregation ATPase